MNDLLSSSFSQFSRESDGGGVQMTSMGVNLDKFFQDVEGIKEDLKEVERVHQRLQASHEESKTLHNAKSIKDLRSRMDTDVGLALKKVKLIKARLEALDRANAANRNLPGCGPGSSTDRTRTSILSGLRKKLKDTMESFNTLRQQIGTEYKDTVGRRYFTVTGEKADERTIDILISTGESETFLQKAIQEQGRGRILDTISEIQERHDAARDMERNLLELHQVFLDMSVLVQAQGEQIDDIESQVTRASSFVRGGTQQLQRVLIKDENKVAFEEPNPFAIEGEQVAWLVTGTGYGNLMMKCIILQGVRFRVLLRGFDIFQSPAFVALSHASYRRLDLSGTGFGAEDFSTFYSMGIEVGCARRHSALELFFGTGTLTCMTGCIVVQRPGSLAGQSLLSPKNMAIRTTCTERSVKCGASRPILLLLVTERQRSHYER
ncbi:hypothetical protein HHK36_011484 [Tetracentron sinense]|uniref:t-SNARE coiled-coil homology domain-containing protein n=1 Tax=Tetracentron sinense TaxID=13715 RepID=A0A835DJX5_TETSI|nr:hypothetical protein HHK36_011484 [Tetracentron sinense]